MKRWLLAALAIVACGATLSCKVNDYCLNCATGDGGNGDGGDDLDADGDGGDGDAGDGGACVPTGTEVCDDEDNDCDSNVDEGVLPEVGDDCANQVGECAGGKKQCVAGAITCTKNPSPEVCDNKDNDCNGAIDQGDPGGGAKCGTDKGECVAGTFHCNLVTHVVECQGAVGGLVAPFGTPESCDGRDNDCDDNFDEGLGSLGSCPGTTGVGECEPGTLMCVGGGAVCVGDKGPAFEACDTLDNDCDGTSDEDTNKLTDPTNCGSCGFVCDLPNAFEGCAGGNCTVVACQTGFHDNNAQPGCEFGPCTIQGAEVCNGVNDDCNPATNENTLPAPPGLCLTVGACAGATASCHAADGFRCDYGTDVSHVNGIIEPEAACDGIDNDCDGNIDEGQPNLGQACNDNGVGICRGFGTFQCDSLDPDGPAVCVITTPGQAMAAESCDGQDNDCNGVVDNGAEGGDLPGQDWVLIPGSSPATEIMKYEASRPDATATTLGTNQAFACSKQTVQPWTNLTHPQAETACASIGARLCSEPEWQAMCSQPPTVSYPVNGPTGATDHVFIEAEQAQANVGKTSGGTARTFANDTNQNFSGLRDLIATPNTGADVSAANAPTQSPRVDFQINFTQTGSHFVWVRTLAQNGADTGVWTGINAVAGSTAVNTQLVPGQFQFWQWAVSPSFNIAATGNQFVSVFMRRDGVRIDAISISRDGVNPPPVDDKIWAFQNNPKFPQAQVCNGDEFDTVPGGTDQDDILATGARPQCFANGTGTDDAFDMSGNVKEWTLQRAPGQNPLRGGASNNEVNGLTCGLGFTLADDEFFFPNVGFRCCRLQ